MIWHILTGEYPPGCGGVGDYSALLAHTLKASGDAVVVWAPHVEQTSASEPGPEWLRRLPDRFGAESRTVLSQAWREQPGVVLLQYVPNALGAKGANLPFCRWLHAVGRSGMDVRVMFHEPYFYFSMERPWRNLLAVVQRMMAAELIKASRVVYVSSDAWIPCLSPYAALPPTLTLPIPSTIPDDLDLAAIGRVRRAVAGDSSDPVIGHFGTYGNHLVAELDAIVPAIAEVVPSARFAFIGDRSTTFLDRLSSRSTTLASRAWASGRLSSPDVAAALRACDLLVQPYPDGVTTRRTSVMAGLANGVAIVTTDGFLTEAVWRETGAARLTPTAQPTQVACAVRQLVDAPADRAALGESARRTYEERFSIARTVEKLRASHPVEAVAG